MSTVQYYLTVIMKGIIAKINGQFMCFLTRGNQNTVLRMRMLIANILFPPVYFKISDKIENPMRPVLGHIGLLGTIKDVFF
jgi:hypothetical protein